MDPEFFFNDELAPMPEFTFEDNDSIFGHFTPLMPSKKDDLFDSVSVNGNSTNDSISEIATTKMPVPKRIDKKLDKKKYSFPCPLCNQSVQPYNVKGDELIFMCLNKQCIFPYNLRSQVREFKTKEDKVSKVYQYLKSKFGGCRQSKASEDDRDYLDPIRKLKI